MRHRAVSAAGAVGLLASLAALIVVAVLTLRTAEIALTPTAPATPNSANSPMSAASAEVAGLNAASVANSARTLAGIEDRPATAADYEAATADVPGTSFHTDCIEVTPAAPGLPTFKVPVVDLARGTLAAPVPGSC